MGTKSQSGGEGGSETGEGPGTLSSGGKALSIWIFV